ncbi:MAG: OmpH family outer membrane protein [Thermodesulfobacteriota bacterium]
MVAKTFKCFGFCLVAVFCTLAWVAGVSADDAKNDKIVTVNTKQIIQKHPAFIEAQQTLQREAQQFQQQMEGKKQQERQAAQEQFQQRAQKLQKDALDEVRKDIQKIADDKGYKYVMDENVVLAGAKDVTEEILEDIGK